MVKDSSKNDVVQELKIETRSVVEKKIPGEKIVYVLRCLWAILQDEKPETQKIIRWHPIRPDAFIIEDENELDEYLKKYDMFQTNFGTFRRSLYFYGFKKRKNVWSHSNLNKEDRQSLLNIHRKKKETKITRLQQQLRKKYEKLIRDTMMNGFPNFTMPSMVGKNRSPPNAMANHHYLAPSPHGNPMMPHGLMPPGFGMPPFGFVRSPTYTDAQMFGDNQVMKNEPTKDMETDDKTKMPTRMVDGRSVATLPNPSFNSLPGFFNSLESVPESIKELMPSTSPNSEENK